MRVRALKRFYLNGQGNVGPGLVEVPDEKVERLVRLKMVARPDPAGLSEADRIEESIARISGTLGVGRESGESVADFLERLAGEAEGFAVKAKGGDTTLPDDFPGVEHLREAGYDTLESVRELSKEEIIALKGIGPATAEKILEAAG
jgi:hypothetical protein